MVAAKISLATSVWVVLALLHQSTATANVGVPGDKPGRGARLHTDDSDVILLSVNGPWKEEHSTFARWIRRPITTWSVHNQAFTDNYISAMKGSRKPVFVIVDTAKKPSTREILHVRWLTFERALLILSKPNITNFLASTRLVEMEGVFNAGYLTLNETSIQSFFWPQESSADQNPGSRSTVGKVAQFDGHTVQNLGGTTLRVTCVNISHDKSIEDTCNDASLVERLAFLNRRNITVELMELPNYNSLVVSMLVNHSDIGLYPVALHDDMSFAFDFPMTFIAHDTFYSRVDPHRVVSLLEVGSESLNVVATTVLMLVLVVLAYLVIGNKHSSFFKDLSDTALFLLAAVLATSAVQPNVRGRAGIARKALLGLWLVSLLPLSVYFRTELTAIVTLQRPAYRIDTLEKLEDALYRRQVAPCVVRHTLSYRELRFFSFNLPEQSLLKKLQVEFRRQAGALVRNNLSECLQCASRRDRVCYIGPWRHPNSSLLKLASVAAFSQHLKMELSGYLMQKSHRMYRSLKRTFQHIEEHKLLLSNVRAPEYANGETEIVMGGLFMLLGILHATSCLVLMVEVAVDRYMRRL